MVSCLSLLQPVPVGAGRPHLSRPDQSRAEMEKLSEQQLQNSQVAMFHVIQITSIINYFCKMYYNYNLGYIIRILINNIIYLSFHVHLNFEELKLEFFE